MLLSPELLVADFYSPLNETVVVTAASSTILRESRGGSERYHRADIERLVHKSTALLFSFLYISQKYNKKQQTDQQNSIPGTP